MNYVDHYCKENLKKDVLTGKHIKSLDEKIYRIVCTVRVRSYYTYYKIYGLRLDSESPK